MKISIITAAYNSEKTLERCLDSVANQTALESIEHIIIDGKSSDKTLSIAASYPHIAKIVSEKDRGIYHAFNRGVEQSTGDIVYFLNSDDVIFDNDVISDVLTKFTDELYFYCGKILKVNDATGDNFIFPSGKNNKKNFKSCHPGFFCRRKYFEDHGLFNECFSIAADSFMMKTVVSKYKGIFTDRIISKFQTAGVSSMPENFDIMQSEDYAIDILLGKKQSKFIEKKTNQEAFNQVKRLFLKELSNSFDLKGFENKNILIFGTRKVSVIIYKLLSKHEIPVAGFLVSSESGYITPDNITVYGLAEVVDKKIDIIINCIEGEHEKEVTNTLLKTLPEINVVSWRDI